MRYTKTAITALTVAAMVMGMSNSYEVSPNATRHDVALFVEGLLDGIIQEEGANYTDLVHCILDTGKIEVNLRIAFEDLDKKTVEGVKESLVYFALVAKEVPIAIKDCHIAESELVKLVEIAEIFEHPMQLIYRAGKNLMVNGVDIFKKMMSALMFYKEGNYLETGRSIGEAMDEILLKTSAFMNPPTLLTAIMKAQSVSAIKITTIDDRAWRFLKGYFNATGLIGSIDQIKLYTHVYSRGAMVYGPVQNLMKTLTDNQGVIDLRVWMALH